MTARLLGACAAALGLVVGIAPFLDWYRADLAGRQVVVAGVDVAGELWTLPALAVTIMGIGVALAAVRPHPRATAARWAGAALVLLGVFALAWTLKSVFDVPTVAQPVDLPDGPRAPLEAQPVAFICAAAAAGVACTGFAWLRAGSG